MARQAAEAGLAIARKRGGKRSEITVAEREVRARIPESRGQKRISENDGRIDLDEADLETATNNTKIGQVHIPTPATRVRQEWIDLVDGDWERDPLVRLECWSNRGRANFDPSTEIPLLTVPSDASTREAEKARVPSISVGVKMGVEHVEHGKPNSTKTRGYVCIGGLDTNDHDETEECFDAYETNGYLDERTGLMLDEALTKQAETEEVEFMQKIRLYDVVSNSECWDKTGRPPISTKWVRVNKGTQEAPDIRCRLVARDFKPKGEKDRSEIFAAMPPLESKKLLFQQAMTQNALNRLRGEDGLKIMLIDVKKAHLNGFVGEDEFAYIELPRGWLPRRDSVGVCAGGCTG